MLRPDERTIVTKDALFDVLREMDRSVRGITQPVEIYCVGGTLMMLENVRQMSKDIDFIASRDDFRALSNTVAMIELQRKIRTDVFPDGAMPDYNLSGYDDGARRLNVPLRYVHVFGVSKPVFLLTKLIAGRPHDLEDIAAYVSPSEVKETEVRAVLGRCEFRAEKENELRGKFETLVKQFYA